MHFVLRLSLILGLLLTAAVPSTVHPQDAGRAYFVSTAGDDAGPGTEEAPFSTLERARKAVRDWKGTASNDGRGVTVFIREGVYTLDSTFVLDERDSGTPDGRVTFRSYPGENARIIGGRFLDPATATPDTGSVVRFDLKAAGISDFGRHVQYGHGQPVVPAPLELFFNSEAMPLARYPNEGSMLIGEIVDPGSMPRVRDYSNRGAIFKYTDDRHAKWVGLDNVWLQGTFMWGYADDMIRVEWIDPETHEVKLASPHMYGVGTGKPYRHYVAVNIRSELDSPGEWYLDRETGILYFWPPAPLEGSEIAVSMLEDPLIELMDASYVTVSELTVELGRGMGIYMEGGEHNLLAGLTVRNVGTTGILLGQGARQNSPGAMFEDYEGVPVSGEIGSLLTHLYHNTTWNRNAGTNHTILSCNVYNTGAGGVFIGGGDRKTLEPGHTTVENSRFWNNQRRNKFLWAGINVSGVGNRVAHNEVFDSDFQAIMAYGNDHVFEYNHVHDIGMDSDDTSPWYMGRDPSGRGNVVRYNFFHDIGRPDRMGMGVYMDDGTSGTLVHGNVFCHVASYGTVYSNAGSDNVVTNNIFVDGFGPAFHLKSMWFTWANRLIDYYWGEGGVWRRRLQELVDVKSPPYSERYPELSDWMDLMPDGETYFGMIPSRNVFDRNLVVDYEEVLRLDYPNIGIEVRDNWTTTEDPGFIDRAHDNFGLRDDAPVFDHIPGFERIPFAEIGLYQDEYRQRLDSADEH